MCVNRDILLPDVRQKNYICTYLYDRSKYTYLLDNYDIYDSNDIYTKE